MYIELASEEGESKYIYFPRSSIERIESSELCSGQVVVDTFNSDNSNFTGDRSSLAECNLSTL